MSERLPYEEQLTQQWDDLPLPDENMAWADMKRRLDEDDDDRLIPVWLRGCALWGITGIVLIGLGWWILRPGKWFESKKKSSQEVVIKPSTPKQKDQPLPVAPGKEKTTTEESATPKNAHPGIDQTEEKNKLTKLDESSSKTDSRKKAIPGKRQAVKKKISQQNGMAFKKKQEQNEPVVTIPPKTDSVIGQKKISSDEQSEVPGKNIDFAYGASDSTKKASDSLQQKKEPGISKAPEQKKDSVKKKSVWFAAGIAMNQQLPVNGEKFNPYNAEGRKASLADYIPSVYLRMHKNDKWFIQSEFRYGAPQYNREILYYQKAQPDTFNLTITTTSVHLKKTFYHQLPVSFNYFVTKNWSLGAGFAWNKFESAVSSLDIIRHYSQTNNDSIIVKGKIISSKSSDSMNLRPADSNFVKSYFQGIVETHYRWKRFSIGLRYAFGLEPYLKFKLPGGVQQQEKNNSLNLFLRYELWRSKK